MNKRYFTFEDDDEKMDICFNNEFNEVLMRITTKEHKPFNSMSFLLNQTETNKLISILQKIQKEFENE